MRPFKREIALIIVACFMMLSSFAQEKYFILRENSKDYIVKSYVLSTDSLYKVSAKVELFNLYPQKSMRFQRDSDGIKDQNLYLFSVLPDLKSGVDWKEISLDTIINDTLSFSKLRNLATLALMERYDIAYIEETKYLNKYKLIVERSGRFYVAKHTLLQFYAIRDRSDFFQSLFGTINIQQRLMSINEFRVLYRNTFPNDIFPLDKIGDDVYGVFDYFDRIRDRKEFLSKIFSLKGHKAYQFWTFMDWGGPIARSLNGYEFYRVERGIDRFVYIPNLGIVGGSFDFFFYIHRKEIGVNVLDLKININTERVMIANELLM